MRMIADHLVIVCHHRAEYRLMSPSPLTYMSLAGKFFPSTIRINRELLLAMAEHTDRDEAPVLRYIQRCVSVSGARSSEGTNNNHIAASSWRRAGRAWLGKCTQQPRPVVVRSV